MLGQLSGEEELHRGLHRARGHGLPLAHSHEVRRLAAESVERVVHQRVHNAHGSPGDAHVGVDLLQDLVNVKTVRLLSSLLSRGGGRFLSSGHFIRSNFGVFTFLNLNASRVAKSDL